MSNKPIIRMYTINEAAKAFPGLSAHRIRLLIKSGELAHICAGKKYLVCGEVIKKYIFQSDGNNGIMLPSDDLVAE